MDVPDPVLKCTWKGADGVTRPNSRECDNLACAGDFLCVDHRAKIVTGRKRKNDKASDTRASTKQLAAEKIAAEKIAAAAPSGLKESIRQQQRSLYSPDNVPYCCVISAEELLGDDSSCNLHAIIGANQFVVVTDALPGVDGAVVDKTLLENQGQWEGVRQESAASAASANTTRRQFPPASSDAHARASNLDTMNTQLAQLGADKVYERLFDNTGMVSVNK
ncbi:hypothetical protein B484DRAFT_471901, partial [Ochromonadaceae sp. CCMP2298]